MIQLEPLVGIKELGNELGINHYTIYKMIRENKFPKGVKYMGRRKFRRSDIEEYFTSLRIRTTVEIE